MNATRAIAILTQRQAEAESLLGATTSSSQFTKWYRDSEISIERIFGHGCRHLKDFRDVSYSLGFFTTSTTDREFAEAHQRGLRNAHAVFASMIDEITSFGLGDDIPESAPDELALIERLCTRFHIVARQLAHRHADRSTILIADEYDVQDLMHGLLRLHFDDIRDEEWTPSYAGGGSRVDFLLKDERIVIEIKKTRAKLRAKEVGEQLLIDRERYQSHPDCKTLVCFVYDPDGFIQNPTGIENDLRRNSGSLNVRVFIAPRLG